MTVDRIKDLILKHLRSEISGQENIELQTWLVQSEENRQLFEEITDPKELANSFRKLDNLHKSEVWDRVKGYADEKRAGSDYVGDFENPGKSRSSWISGYNKWWAAAAILVGISFGAYFLIKNQKTSLPAITASTIKTDIAPGGNKAVLTLSNGSQIILDSAHNGLLAKQGNVNVSKTGNGRIAYNTAAEKPTEIGSNKLSTPRGGQYQLMLPDGTKVWLNSASSIMYPTAFVGRERKVEITGEAYFEVIHNSKMPFRVKANDQIIEDIGTAFNVNAYPDEKSLNTTLIEGSVQIIVDQKFHSYEVVLKPGQQAQMTEDKIKVKPKVDIDKIVAWKNGKMSLTGSSVPQIMREISRWYDMDIKYSGDMPEKKFYGLIDRNVPLSTVLMALKNYGVGTKIDGKTIIVQ